MRNKSFFSSMVSNNGRLYMYNFQGFNIIVFKEFTDLLEFPEYVSLEDEKCFFVFVVAVFLFPVLIN